MRALSVRQPYAELIARGEKNVEYRSWTTRLRGRLLIVASASRQDGDCAENDVDPDSLVYGAAVCVVDVINVTGSAGSYEWHLRNPVRVKPEPIQGFASLYTVDDVRIRRADGSALPAAAETRVVETKKPRQPARRASPTPKRANTPPAPLVLVVDENASRRNRATNDLLEALPTIAVADASSRVDAMSKIRNGAPALVVLNGSSAELEASSVCAQIAKLRDGGAPKVIAIGVPRPRPRDGHGPDQWVRKTGAPLVASVAKALGVATTAEA